MVGKLFRTLAGDNFQTLLAVIFQIVGIDIINAAETAGAFRASGVQHFAIGYVQFDGETANGVKKADQVVVVVVVCHR